MKLLTKTSIYFISSTAILFIINAFVIYKSILQKFDAEVDENLRAEKAFISGKLKEGYKPEEVVAKTDPLRTIKQIGRQSLFSDRYVYSFGKETYEEDENAEEALKLKTLVFQVAVKDKAYEVRITGSLSESEEIGSSIGNVIFMGLFATLLVLCILNFIISRSIWSPFRNTLSQIKQWGVKSKYSLALKKTNISEFNTLNRALNELALQIKTDYLNLKEFTENVSHEAQTPLAILSNKLELLLQEPNYSHQQAELLLQAYQAVQRLYKLNKALVLLARIENKQFTEMHTVNLNQVIDGKLDELEDFIEAKNITIEKEYTGDCIIRINQDLLNVLLDNLLNNAIKYNDNNGIIRIIIKKDSFSIKNTSPFSKIDDLYLFERASMKSNSNSLGIGLSLIKKIVDLYGWDIQYDYIENRLHRFKIYFNAPPAQSNLSE